jgi:hypothetical protein
VTDPLDHGLENPMFFATKVFTIACVLVALAVLGGG